MYRYISLHWNPEDPSKLTLVRKIAAYFHHSHTNWDTVFQSNGILTLQTGIQANRMQAYHLHDGNGTHKNGVILGKLFKIVKNNNYVSCTTSLDCSESSQIIETEGRYLVDQYWGRYVAFLKDGASGTHYVLRAPTGALPCFWTIFQGVTICFSRMEDIVDLDILNFTINWANVAEYLIYQNIQKNETCLDNVFELLPGQCLKISSANTIKEFYWDPVRVAQTNIVEDKAEAAQALREITLNCISVWAEGYKNILHRLSGGLDSSIVLAGLLQTKNSKQIVCLNYFTPSMDGDERLYARLVAKEANVELFEYGLQTSDINIHDIMGMPRSAQPRNVLLEQAKGPYELKLIDRKKLEACFFGSGGDHVFFQPHTALGAYDYIYRHGINTHLFIIAMEAARLERSSVWSVLRRSLAQKVFHPPWNPYTEYYKQECSIINPEILSYLNEDDILHPWMRNASDELPPGKLLHIYMATVAPSYYEALIRPAEFLEPVHPLFSQPLVELCLRIPVYTLTAEGRDRGLARMAFANSLPTRIVTRESKGAANEFFKSFYQENKRFIREFLLEGILVKEKLLDREKLEKALCSDRADIDTEQNQILTHLNTEAWLRSWTK